MKIPTTINYSFNNAITHLLEFHPVFYLTGPALDMGKRPTGLRTDKAWQHYLGCLTSVMRIGLRNEWLRLHVNRRGCPTYWLLEIPSHHIKKDSKPIWSDEK